MAGHVLCLGQPRPVSFWTDEEASLGSPGIHCQVGLLFSVVSLPGLRVRLAVCVSVSVGLSPCSISGSLLQPHSPSLLLRSQTLSASCSELVIPIVSLPIRAQTSVRKLPPKPPCPKSPGPPSRLHRPHVNSAPLGLGAGWGWDPTEKLGRFPLNQRPMFGDCFGPQASYELRTDSNADFSSWRPLSACGLGTCLRSSDLPSLFFFSFLSFFFLFKVCTYVCIYLFLAALGLRCSECGLLFVAVRGLLIAVASLVEEHGL